MDIVHIYDLSPSVFAYLSDRFMNCSRRIPPQIFMSCAAGGTYSTQRFSIERTSARSPIEYMTFHFNLGIKEEGPKQTCLPRGPYTCRQSVCGPYTRRERTVHKKKHKAFIKHP